MLPNISVTQSLSDKFSLVYCYCNEYLPYKFIIYFLIRNNFKYISCNKPVYSAAFLVRMFHRISTNGKNSFLVNDEVSFNIIIACMLQ